MVQWLKRVSISHAPAEDLSSFPRTHVMLFKATVTLAPTDLMPQYYLAFRSIYPHGNGTQPPLQHPIYFSYCSFCSAVQKHLKIFTGCGLVCLGSQYFSVLPLESRILMLDWAAQPHYQINKMWYDEWVSISLNFFHFTLSQIMNVSKHMVYKLWAPRILFQGIRRSKLLSSQYQDLIFVSNGFTFSLVI